MYLRFTPRLVKLFILLTLLMLLGCEQTSQPSDPLNDTKWILRSLYGRPPLDATIITLEFTQGYVGGNSGCNDFGGKNLSEKYQISDDGSLTIASFATTMVLCTPTEIMDQEEAYIEALHRVVRYRLTKGQLELENGMGDTILVFTDRRLVTRPYLVSAILAGGVTLSLLWFLWKNR